MMQDLPGVEDLLEADDAPIIRMLNALLTQAAGDGASDIHIEPTSAPRPVRFRVDGTLREVVQPNKALHAALISRLKIMAELDIAEKRLPRTAASRCASAAARWTCACRRCRRRAWRACRAAPARQGRGQFTLGPGHAGAVPSGSTSDRSSRTASCSSPARPARARRRRCTPRSAASTPRAPTC